MIARGGDMSARGFIKAREKAHVGSESVNPSGEVVADFPQKREAGAVGGLGIEYHGA